MKRTFGTVLIALAALVSVSAHAARNAGILPAPHVTWNAGTCAGCHAPSEETSLLPRLSRPCRTLCTTCHSDLSGHHPVGVRIAGSIPPPLLLTDRGSNTCSTCHDVTLPRVEGTAWASQSLVARLSRRSPANRTYLLVLRNDRGQLCRNCH